MQQQLYNDSFAAKVPIGFNLLHCILPPPPLINLLNRSCHSIDRSEPSGVIRFAQFPQVVRVLPHLLDSSLNCSKRERRGWWVPMPGSKRVAMHQPVSARRRPPD